MNYSTEPRRQPDDRQAGTEKPHGGRGRGAHRTGSQGSRADSYPHQAGTDHRDLDPAAYTALNKWIAAAAAEVAPDLPRLSQSAAVRAMINATILDKSIGVVVIDLLRRDLEQA